MEPCAVTPKIASTGQSSAQQASSPANVLVSLVHVLVLVWPKLVIDRLRSLLERYAERIDLQRLAYSDVILPRPAVRSQEPEPQSTLKPPTVSPPSKP